MNATSHAELQAALELLWLLLTDSGTGPLLVLLALAAVLDWCTLRIPNWLTLSGAAYGLAHAALASAPAAGGLGNAALGWLTGLALLLPLYALRAMGAGDVKLMAMAGSFLGPWATFKSTLFVCIVGGAAALLFVARARASRQVAANLQAMLYAAATPGLGAMTGLAAQAAHGSVGRLPFGVSIAIGLTLFLVCRQLGLIA